MQKHIENVLNLAHARFGLEPSLVEVRWDLRGLNAGQAISKHGKLIMRLNPEAGEHLRMTIPHEIAHLVQFAGLRAGKGHDAMWKHICLTLGGNGKRCHNLELTPVRKSSQFEYLLANGEKAILGPIQHKRVQLEGREYQTRKTKLRIHKGLMFNEI